MADPIVPVIALGVVSYANNWYNTGSVTDVKPLLFAGVAGVLLEGFAALGFDKAATAIGWLAFAGMLLGPAQKPSPVDNLLTITGSNGGTSQHGKH